MEKNLNLEGMSMEELENSLTTLLDPQLPTVTGRPKVPDNLTDTLLQQLKPQTRVKLAHALIDIALNGMKESDRLSAIKEIYDRVEGKSRQRVETKTAADDPMLAKLAEFYTNQQDGHNSSPYIDEPITAEVREL